MKKEETNSILNEDEFELSEDALQTVSGGASVIRPSGGKAKPRFPSKCPECNEMLMVPRTNTKDTVTCIFCGAEIDALN